MILKKVGINLSNTMITRSGSESAPSIVFRIIFLEDNKNDVELMEHELKSAGINFVCKQVMDKTSFLSEVQNFNPDIILADYTLPSFNGIQAFRLLKEIDLKLPFILVTGSLSEELALECLNEGVDDFILKSSFKRLPSAVINAYKKKKTENEKEKISKELKTTQDELRLLLGSVQSAREEERKHIAREIHDELGQVLTVLKIDISMLRKNMNSEIRNNENYIEGEFDSIVRLIDATIESVKRIATELRPEVLDHLGVIEAIKWQAKEFESKTGIKCFVNDLQSHVWFKAPLDTTVYRVVQEALTNIARHSQATVVNLTVGLDSTDFLLEIKDNGKGINNEDIKKTKSLGLIGMRERVLLLNGTINIDGSSGKGTTVSVKIPMQS